MIIFYFLLYQIVQIATFPATICYLIWRSLKQKKKIGNLKHRLGFVPAINSNKNIWIHAVSVGETLATEYFIKELSSQGETIYLTRWTTGAAQVSKNFQTKAQAYLPFDFLPCIVMAFLRIKPKALIIVEGDWWPNLIFFAHFLKIPIYGLNARVTEHQGIGKLIFKIIGYCIINRVKKLFVQTSKDLSLFKQNLVSEKKIEVLGNIKAYNVLQKINDRSLEKKAFSFPVVMVGSIHPSEWDILQKTFYSLLNQQPTVRLIIVPRHLHWLESLTTSCQAIGTTFVLKENPQESFSNILEKHKIIIGGAMGIMFDLYAYANLFILGGTFIPIGGHNLLEPAVWGITSIVGPYHKNCNDTLQSLKKVSAGFVAADKTELLNLSLSFLAKRTALEQQGAAAKQWLTEDAAQCKKTVEKLINIVS